MIGSDILDTTTLTAAGTRQAVDPGGLGCGGRTTVERGRGSGALTLLCAPLHGGAGSSGGRWACRMGRLCDR